MSYGAGFCWGDGEERSRSGVRVSKTRGGSETPGRWYQAEAGTFAKRTLKKHWPVWGYAKGHVMAMGCCTQWCEPVSSPKETLLPRVQNVGRGPVSFSSVLEMSMLGAQYMALKWDWNVCLCMCMCMCVHICVRAWVWQQARWGSGGKLDINRKTEKRGKAR